MSKNLYYIWCMYLVSIVIYSFNILIVTQNANNMWYRESFLKCLKILKVKIISGNILMLKGYDGLLLIHCSIFVLDISCIFIFTYYSVSIIFYNISL